MRINSLDTWRGLVIFLMVLDHTRDFFFRGALVSTPTEAGHTTVALYFTRWITHLCAPTFVLLAGISIRLQREKDGPSKRLSLFLVTRGAWLVFIDLTIVSIALNFAVNFFYVQVLYATGVSMMAMAALVWLRPRFVTILGAVIVALVPLTIRPLQQESGTLALLAHLAVLPGGLPGGIGTVVYPFLPWFGILCLGFGYGKIFLLPKQVRDRIVGWSATCALIAFGILRGLNRYGDSVPWKLWSDFTRSAESFMNVSKYPPSPDYVLVTLGASLLIFLLIDRLGRTVIQPLTTFGRTPLFVYVLQFLVLHSLQVVIGLSLGFPFHVFQDFLAPMVGSLAGSLHGKLPDPTRLAWGFPLWGVYLVWLAVVALIYPLSRWFEGIKATRKTWWLRYL